MDWLMYLFVIAFAVAALVAGANSLQHPPRKRKGS